MSLHSNQVKNSGKTCSLLIFLVSDLRRRPTIHDQARPKHERPNRDDLAMELKQLDESRQGLH